ncbi:MAG: hypothetical protein ACR2N9_04325 [Acidimicrobiia bacterium]
MTEPDMRSFAVREGPLPPEEYPWWPIDRPGVLADRQFLPTDEIDQVLATLGAKRMADRHRVLAVGSNASFDVMHRKMARVGLATPLPMTINPHKGVAVGHSAHVSLPGYIAAAPYQCADCVRRFVAVHLDDDQLDALDATEPNYSRIEHEGAWIYASNWPVIAVGGVPVPLQPQDDLHSVLRSADPEWNGRFGTTSASEVARQLAHDGSVNEWRHHWRSAGLTRHAGF